MKNIFYFLLLPPMLWQTCIAQDLQTDAKSLTPKSLFSSDTLLKITITGNVRGLINDRTGVSANYQVKVVYDNAAKVADTLPATGRTRGHFRRLTGNCIYPPLLISFTDSINSSTIFQPNHKLKLVMPCRTDDYVVREWLVYKLYSLITPVSLRARLVKVHLDESKKSSSEKLMYGILLEPEKEMAARNKFFVTDEALLPEQTDLQNFLTVAMFEYLIGNTDWSVKYRQNIIGLREANSTKPIITAYDFDHAGLVNAPYAKPTEELELAEVTQRRYRGICIEDLLVYDPIIEKFNRLKNDIYSLYKDCPYIDEKYRKFAISFIDDFYATINKPASFKKEFLYPCDKNGTGNVIIRGMKDN